MLIKIFQIQKKFENRPIDGDIMYTGQKKFKHTWSPPGSEPKSRPCCMSGKCMIFYTNHTWYIPFCSLIYTCSIHKEKIMITLNKNTLCAFVKPLPNQPTLLKLKQSVTPSAIHSFVNWNNVNTWNIHHWVWSKFLIYWNWAVVNMTSLMTSQMWNRLWLTIQQNIATKLTMVHVFASLLSRYYWHSLFQVMTRNWCRQAAQRDTRS